MRKIWLLVIGVVLAFSSVGQAIGPNPYTPFDEEPCYCVWGRLEYLHWYLERSPYPTVLATGTGTGATVLFGGDQGYDGFHGGRISVGGWLDSMGTLGIEGSAMILEQRTTGGSFPSTGADVVVLGATPITLAAGTAFASSTLNFWQANGDFVLTTCRVSCVEVNWLTGFQYLNLREDFNLQYAPTVGDVVGDTFNTTNQFYGGELGARLTLRNYVFFLEGLAKVGLGANYQTVNVASINGGLLTDTTNAGYYTRTVFAVIPAATVRAGLEISDHLKTWIGYDFLYISNVVRPGAQIDTTNDPPVFPFATSSFFAHGLNLGVELRF